MAFVMSLALLSCFLFYLASRAHLIPVLLVVNLSLCTTNDSPHPSVPAAPCPARRSSRVDRASPSDFTHTSDTAGHLGGCLRFYCPPTSQEGAENCPPPADADSRGSQCFLASMRFCQVPVKLRCHIVPEPHTALLASTRLLCDPLQPWLHEGLLASMRVSWLPGSSLTHCSLGSMSISWLL